MDQAEAVTKKQKKSSSSRNGDWTCQFCNNYNYSFRVICKFLLIKVIVVQLINLLFRGFITLNI